MFSARRRHENLSLPCAVAHAARLGQAGQLAGGQAPGPCAAWDRVWECSVWWEHWVAWVPCTPTSGDTLLGSAWLLGSWEQDPPGCLDPVRGLRHSWISILADHGTLQGVLWQGDPPRLLRVPAVTVPGGRFLHTPALDEGEPTALAFPCCLLGGCRRCCPPPTSGI